MWVRGGGLTTQARGLLPAALKDVQVLVFSIASPTFLLDPLYLTPLALYWQGPLSRPLVGRDLNRDTGDGAPPWEV